MNTDFQCGECSYRNPVTILAFCVSVFRFSLEQRDNVHGDHSHSWTRARPLSVSFITSRKCGLIMRSVASVCLSVCPVHALTFENFDLETSFSVRGYVFRICRLYSYIRVIG